MVTKRKIQLMVAATAAAASAAIAGVAIAPAANAADLGMVAVEVSVPSSIADPARTLSRSQVWNLTWSKAHRKCKSEYPRTKSLTLVEFDVMGASERKSVLAVWTCRDN